MTHPLMDFCHHQAEYVHQAARDWKAGPAEAPLARDLAELCILLGPACDAVTRSARDALAEDRPVDFPAFGRQLEALFDDVLRAFELARPRLREAVDRGVAVDNLAEFEEVDARIRQAWVDLLARWPRIDEEMLATSRAQYEAGQYQDVDQLLDELRDRSSCGLAGHSRSPRPEDGCPAGSCKTL